MKLIKIVLTITAMLLSVIFTTASAQMNPVAETVDYQRKGDKLQVVIKLNIQKGWHVYSTGTEDGPTWATAETETAENAQQGKITFEGNEISKHDDMFGMDVKYFENEVTFFVNYSVKDDYKVEGYFQYGCCNDMNCLPPTSIEFATHGKVEAAPKRPESNVIASEKTATTANVPSVETTPVEIATIPPEDIQPAEEPTFTNTLKQENSKSLWWIFWTCFLGGFVALLTPCVWPIIPLTVSYFLKKSAKENQSGVKNALLYGLMIVVIYVSLGLLVTALLGASSLNDLSTNATFNIFFFVMLMVFGLGFLGAFDLSLPSSWGTSVNKKARKTNGILGILLMAFTLALVSFSCTGPIIGFLLVEVGTGSLAAPLIGMFGFSLALALPFTLFAMFPSAMKKMPQSGNWMNTIKVVLGFIEIAFALKFLSVADMAYGWGILPRETFICIWIALAIIMSLFLLNIVKLGHIEPQYTAEGEIPEVETVGTVQLLLATASMAFALYLIPGLWGAPLKAVSAFTPPMNTQDFNLYDGNVEAKYNNFDDALEAARQTGKPLLIDFTGYGCVNCRKMEQSVWTDENVKKIIEEKFILVSLYVDDKTPLPEGKQTVTDKNGNNVVLRTWGDKWSLLQREQFDVNAQPFYVKLTPNGKPYGTPYGFNDNIEMFVDFLTEKN